MELKGFITNLGKYNEGFLEGEWITFPIDEEELNEVLQRIGCRYEDEEGNEHNLEYEEFFFTDWECEIDLDLGEYESIDDLNEKAEAIATLDEYDLKVFEAACDYWGAKYIDVLEFSADDYRLYEDIDNEYDLGYYWIEESGCYDTRNWGSLSNYFDYEAFGRDINLEANGGFCKYGFIERC